MLHVVIMAGGSGTRFWPASRRDRPKQFLSLAGERTLLAATADRVLPMVPAERLWVVTACVTAELTRRELPKLPPDNVVGEPVGRDTAACVGLAATLVSARDPEAVCLVLPADHVIPDAERFRAALAAGAGHGDAAGGLLTFGLRPTRPETGFGYLRLGPEVARRDGWPVHALERFVEKPDVATAARYLADGGYLWNSGMFAWRAAELLDEIGRQLPVLSSGLAESGAALGSDRGPAVLAEVYPRLPRISVDFGIMEGARRCFSLPVDFGWSDVGSWPALAEVLTADGAGTVSRGRVLSLDSAGSVLVSDGPTIAAVGVADLVVVATRDAVLVVPKDQAQRVKEVVAALAARGWDDLL